MERQDFILGLLRGLSADELVQLHNELIVLTDDMDNEFFAMENFDTVTDGMANYEIFRARQWVVPILMVNTSDSAMRVTSTHSHILVSCAILTFTVWPSQ